MCEAVLLQTGTHSKLHKTAMTEEVQLHSQLLWAIVHD